ncbi:hypothetical protein N2152v2_011263 [Parachlorella kessleri]
MAATVIDDAHRKQRQPAVASGAGCRGLRQSVVWCLGQRPATAVAEPCKDALAVLPAGTAEAGPEGVAAAMAAGSAQIKGGGRRKQQPTKNKNRLITKKGGSRKAAAAAATKSPTATSLALLRCGKFVKMQRSSEFPIRKLPFQRVVRKITDQCMDKKIKWTGEALLATQKAVEAVLTTLLGAGNLCAIHAKRVTLTPKDLQLVKGILKELGVHILESNK